MGVIDKVIAAVTPDPSDEDLQNARAKARSIAGSTGWFASILDHHEQIEGCFAAVKGASSVEGRKTAQKELALILSGHSIAEESVIYPAMASTGQEGGSGELYTEQSAAKVQMALLDALDPTSQDYLDKLEHIRGAVAHHVYEEESKYFPTLKEEADSATQAKLTRKYKEEYERYVGPAA
jgi:hemerythrin superfamily protein